MIAARSFAGPGSGARGLLPLDRRASFHGTHVAGIAAGNAGTTAGAGRDHPVTTGLSGVAPRAWIGNYRVFNAPTPVGNSAFTPEIVAAFESAVVDGMDVINFSGGAPENPPENDAVIEAVRNVTLAGVPIAISAGNDRGEFGLGSIGTPGTAPEAITVAAVSNAQVFAPALTVVSPAIAGGLRDLPIQRSGTATPLAWATSDQTIVDVGTIMGTDGRPVDRNVCAPGADPNGARTTLPPGSLAGSIALVTRGICAFVVKAQHVKAAGAIGIVFVNNRPGEASGVPVELAVPGGMISDLDGARLIEAMQRSAGRAVIRIGRSTLDIVTGRSGVPTYFSAAGPTSFDHRLKPDIAAPGGQILSATLPEAAGTPFAVFDGTSMAAPHIAGAVALLLQRHPSWTPQQVKSALMSTAGVAYADTARTAEAPVLLEGAGLANLPAADDPKIFTSPQSVSLDDVNGHLGAQSPGTLVTLTDAGGGAGTWSVEVRPQASTLGVGLDLPPSVTLAPGGSVSLPFGARVALGAVPGEQFGFIVLRRGADQRRIPYFFLVSRPQLEGVPARKLEPLQVGTTATGVSKVGLYRFPSTPFGPAPNFVGPPMAETGAERLYVTNLNRVSANIGVSVIASSEGSLIHPFFLGSRDENDVQGYTGTPVNVNAYMFDYRFEVGAAGVQFPTQGKYYVAVDSGRDRFTGRAQAGSYLLNAWVNDVLPPAVQLVTTQVSAGHPLLVARIGDNASGVDPFSLVISYNRALVGAAFYDPFSGIALFPLPSQAPALKAGRTDALLVASDYQETKNLDQASTVSVMPNTTFRQVRIRGVAGPAVTWIFPDAGKCVEAREGLLATASSVGKVDRVRFLVDNKLIGVDRKGASGLYGVTWRTAGLKTGKHLLRVSAVDAAGRVAESVRAVRRCAKKS
ncbi:MAG: S8 family serine peptidase [Gaiellaceae bacterium]